MEFSWQENWSGWPLPSPGDLPNSGIKSRSPALQVDSLPSEPPGKPKNTGVGCHFILQGIFPTPGSNLNLLLGRWILYHWATWEALIFIKHQQLNTAREIVITAVPSWHIQLPASVYLYVLLSSEDEKASLGIDNTVFLKRLQTVYSPPRTKK